MFVVRAIILKRPILLMRIMLWTWKRTLWLWLQKRENIPFLCLKYISDSANDSAATEWSEELHKASVKLRKTLDKIK